MKKILLATTVLALTSGYALAEVAISGSARMGVVTVDKLGGGTTQQFSSRVRIQFDGSGTTDGGLSFGASMRADQFGGNDSTDSNGDTVGNLGTTNGDSTVFVSGSFGKLTMGDVADGAADYLVGQVSDVGYTGNGDANEIDFLGGDATAARYDYTSGALSVSVGVGQVNAGNDAQSIAVKYAPGSYAVAVAYSKLEDDNQIDLMGSATFGAATVKARVADRDSEADTAIAVSLDYVTGPTTLTAFATQNNYKFGGVDTYGVGVAYDLGGGAAVKAGYSDIDGTGYYDAGVTLSF